MWGLTSYACSRLREELGRLARAAAPGAASSDISGAVALLMDGDGAGVSDEARGIAEALLSRAYDPAEPDILYDLLLIHRRSVGLDTAPWSPALVARVQAGLALFRPRRRRW